MAAMSRTRSGLELPCSSRKVTDILILFLSGGRQLRLAKSGGFL
jgi:hypothetical protein